MRIAYCKWTGTLMAFTVAGFLATPFLLAPAFAQQTAQPTDREKAWAACLAEVNKARPATASGDTEAQRVAAFKACMAKFGIRP